MQQLSIPEKITVNDSDFEKVASAFSLLGIKTEIDMKNLVETANDAIEKATYYKETTEKVIRENIKPKFEFKSVGAIRMDWHERLAEDVNLGRTIAVRGPAGNGKSTGATEVLTALGYKIYHLDCTDSTVTEQLVGGLVPEPDGKGGIRMAFREGVFNKAFKDPKGAILLDEFDALDPRVAMCLQSALHRQHDGKRKLSSPDADVSVQVSEGPCPIIATMNTWGNGATSEYVGRNSIDSASMDRFNSIIDTTYSKEDEILTGMGFDKKDVKDIISLVKECRTAISDSGLKILLSTRRVIDIAEVRQKLLMSVEEAFAREFLSRLDPATIAALPPKYKDMKENPVKK